MPDMKSENLEKLRQSVGANQPVLSEMLLSDATAKTYRNPLRYVVPAVAAAAAILVFGLNVSPSQKPAVFSFPSHQSSSGTSGISAGGQGGVIAGPFIQTGVDFIPGPNLSNEPAQGEVWQVKAVDNLSSRMQALANVLGDSAPIKSDEAGWLNDMGTVQLNDTTRTGFWTYYNGLHSLTVNGVCLETKQAGNCVMEHKDLSVEHYRAEAFRVFTAGGWAGSANDIKLTNDGAYTWATVSLLISGQETPISWKAYWFPDGVLSEASGFMSNVVSLGEYAMISPFASVARADNSSQWTARWASAPGPWAPIIEGHSATVTQADTVLGYYGGYLVPSYYLHGDSGKWYRQVLALELPSK